VLTHQSGLGSQEFLNKMAVEDKRFHTLWNSGAGQVFQHLNPEPKTLRPEP